MVCKKNVLHNRNNYFISIVQSSSEAKMKNSL